MTQTQSPTKPTNNYLTIAFANDNFSLKKQFLLKTKTPNLPQNISSSFPFKNNPHSLLNSSLNFKNFKNNPSSAPNASSSFNQNSFSSAQENTNSAQHASSLFSSKLRFDSKSDSRQPLRRFVSLASEGVLAKNAVRIFLTPKPINFTFLITQTNN